MHTGACRTWTTLHVLCPVVLLAGLALGPGASHAAQDRGGDRSGNGAERADRRSLLRELGALRRDYGRALHEWERSEAERRAGRTVEAGLFVATGHPAHVFLPRFRDLARRCDDAPCAVAALSWILATEAVPPEAAAEAADRLIADFSTAPGLTMLAAQIAWRAPDEGYGIERGLAQLARLADGEADPELRAKALYYRVTTWQKVHSDEPAPAWLDRELARLIGLAPSSRTAMLAQKVRWELRHLRIGEVVPDIAGEDLDGKALELSALRGKVVFLHFWADW